jgi:transposase
MLEHYKIDNINTEQAFQIYLKEMTFMTKKSLSRWNGIVEESDKGSDVWVGVDVHKTNYSVSVLTSGGVAHNFITLADDEGLIKQFQERGIKITCLAYEAGPTGFGLYRTCKRHGIEAIVAAASRIPRVPVKTAKTDRIDSKRLVEYLSRDMLKPITIPSEEQEAIRAKVRRRGQLSRDIAKAKARIKSFLLVNGLAEPAGLTCWSQRAMEELKALALQPDLRLTLDSHIRCLGFLEGEKHLLEANIRKSVLPEHDVLQSVPGVGPITSGMFRAEIFDPGRFETSEQLSSYVGLAPVISQSGSNSGYSRLVPCGQGKLRSVLVEAAWRLLSKEEWASKFYHRILSHSGKPQKAIVALARKLAVILWRLWSDERDYESNYNARPAALSEAQVQSI